MNVESNNDKAEQRARKIIDAYFAGKLSRKLDQWISNWLAAHIGSGRLDEALFEKWMETMAQENRPDAETVLEFDRAMEQLGFPEEIRVRLSDRHTAPAVAFAPKRRPSLHRMMLRVAAVLIPVFVIAGVAWWWIGGASDRTASNLVAEITVSVTDGLQKQVTLSDNSEVWVNSDSKLEFAGDVKNSRVAKLAGEAYFKVEKDENKPFIVKTEYFEVWVLGTEFNVNARENNGKAEVALASGSVSVKAGKQQYPLEPGQVLVYDSAAGTAEITVIADADIADWRSLTQNLQNRTLEDILNITAEYYDYEIVITGNLSDDLYSITFRADEPLENLLRPLSISCGEFSYDIKDKSVIINKIK